MQNIFIGRQPIIDQYGNLHGYELLFRQSFDNYAAPISCNTQATCRVLVNSLNNFGSRKLLGKHYGFINIDHTFFNTPLFNAIPADKFVLEILENTLVDDTFIANVKNLKEQGYTFALDDMDLSEEMIVRFEPVFEYLSYIKIDLFSASREKIHEKINVFEAYKGIKLLAEKVETIEDYEYYKKLGFAYFQGYFYEKPTVFTQKRFDPSHRVLLEVIALIDANADIKELEAKLLSCPHLIMNLLKYINSVEIGVKEPISSLRHAMALLGRQSLKQWILLFLYADATGSMFSEPILLSALFRAKMMSCLVTCTLSSMQEEAFLTGLLSLFDVMFGLPMKEVLSGVNLNDLILSALIDKEGTLGEMLDLVISIEEENFSNIQETMTKLDIDEDKLNAMATESYNWSNDFYEEHFSNINV
ncbi:MAG TPA: EAL domain-containing protein [Sulfuricurvum sp.]|nr:EAL domain-containing protein [Sulfuricurvum sp.]